MNCLICASVASCIECQGHWEERDCPHCGHYRMADALILALMEQGQIFDVGRTRKWLIKQRSRGSVLCIQAHEALLAL